LYSNNLQLNCNNYTVVNIYLLWAFTVPLPYWKYCLLKGRGVAEAPPPLFVAGILIIYIIIYKVTLP
jgi:hypothetical protein